MRCFVVQEEGGRFSIRCQHAENFVARADPDTDVVAARRLCDALNTGFCMGYSVGEADAQLALRRVLGVE